MRGRDIALLGGSLLALVGVLIWMMLPDERPAHEPTVAARSEAPNPATGSTERTQSQSTPEPTPTAKSKREGQREQRARRDELRAKLLAAEAKRSQGLRPRPSTPREQEPETEHEPGTMKDRIGGREALLAELNRDFMPLADECIAQALTRTPELSGMLAIGLETIADEELGAIVESVDTPPANEIDDPALHECIQQTALSLILPPPPEGGREAFMLTIPIEPE